PSRTTGIAGGGRRKGQDRRLGRGPGNGGSLMTPEDGFLQAVTESPEDDTPRLVYADWLDDHGQADRAEVIRLQCELARLAPGQDLDHRLGFVEGGTRATSNRIECVLAQVAAEQAGLARGRYPELKRREADLLVAHGERWAQSVRPFVPR